MLAQGGYNDMSVFAAREQIAFPMTGNSAVLNLGRSFANGDGIDDLTLLCRLGGLDVEGLVKDAHTRSASL
jgi:hypothetical protein